jgi:ribosomal protein L14
LEVVKVGEGMEEHHAAGMRDVVTVACRSAGESYQEKEMELVHELMARGQTRGRRSDEM